MAAVLSLAGLLGQPAWAEKGSWDHVANIKDSATRLAVLHRRQGSSGVLKFLDACYRTHLLASEFTQGLESCMAQDYMHSQILATIYSRMPQSDRERLGVPSPEIIAKGMGDRFVAAFAQYKVPSSEAKQFKRLVDKHGFPVFLKGVFPNATGNAAEPDKDKKDKEAK
jgi:hypothetical protein